MRCCMVMLHASSPISPFNATLIPLVYTTHSFSPKTAKAVYQHSFVGQRQRSTNINNLSLTLPRSPTLHTLLPRSPHCHSRILMTDATSTMSCSPSISTSHTTHEIGLAGESYPQNPRKMWAKKYSSADLDSQGTTTTETIPSRSRNHSYVALDTSEPDIETSNECYNESCIISSMEEPKPPSSDISSLIQGAPGLLIAVILNLFLSVSFGPALFPPTMQFPAHIPSTIGVQMWLFSTFICQLVMTSQSDFPSAMGMMMVENIPFMHIIINTITGKEHIYPLYTPYITPIYPSYNPLYTPYIPLI